MTAKLNQIIAVEKGIKSKVHSRFSELYKIVQKNELFNGFSKKYNPKNDEGEKLNAEHKLVQYDVPEVMEKAKSVVSELIDLTYRKDVANMKAASDVVVDGKVVIPNAPVTFLLYMEKQLHDIGTFINSLPVLDSTEQWYYDAEAELYKTDPIITNRTKKEPKVIVLYPATDKHPAQTNLVQEDIIVGEWENIKHSGAIPKHVKEDMLQKVHKLLAAVKQAREKANEYEETESINSIGEQVFNYINA